MIKLDELVKGKTYKTIINCDDVYYGKEIFLGNNEDNYYFFLVNDYPQYSKENFEKILKLNMDEISKGKADKIDREINKEITFLYKLDDDTLESCLGYQKEIIEEIK